MADDVITIEASQLAIGRVLARGSPGVTVYEADLKLAGRTTKVAVKRLCTGSAPDLLQTNFLKEIGTLMLASASCQRVCRMLGCCRLDTDPCIVMTLYTKSCQKRLEEAEGALEIAEVTAIVVEVLEGLSQLHDANILHLDLKPANILLDSYGHAYLSDFGISYALRTLEHCTVLGSPTGTPHYMAPEQVDAELGTRGKHTDIWGLAACVLHLITGRPPYYDLTMMQTASAMMRERAPYVPETLPEWLHLLLKQCFSFDAQRRPTANQLREGPLSQRIARQHVDISSNWLTTAEEVLVAAGSQLAMKPTVFQGLLRHLARLEASGSLSRDVDKWVELLCEYGGFISLSQAVPLSAYVVKGIGIGTSYALVMHLVLDNITNHENDKLTHGCYDGNVVQLSWWPLLQRAIAAAHPKIVASTAAAFYLQWLLTEEAAIRGSFVNSERSYSGETSFQVLFSAVLAAARQHR